MHNIRRLYSSNNYDFVCLYHSYNLTTASIVDWIWQIIYVSTIILVLATNSRLPTPADPTSCCFALITTKFTDIKLIFTINVSIQCLPKFVNCRSKLKFCLIYSLVTLDSIKVVNVFQLKNILLNWWPTVCENLTRGSTTL